jgi:hypothetical protein
MKRIEKSLSEGRKIFRLFKFMDEFSECIKHFRDKNTKRDKTHREVIFYLLKITSFLYYLLDNIVWFSSIKVINKYIAFAIKWKKTKDVCSLCRCALQIISSLSLVVELLEVE